ncbi:Hypothetical_protein [Hexamita inflata]|uniref:Hypothetical_protein n=1 Tax=Hexamita inflata TaxID=28002 RepID=A0AA86TTX2_9EUKA|nr:Hypothetical protein HINF_LOCUS16289 [Hexamita inflata]
MEVEDHKQNNCCFRVASIYYLMLGPTNPLDSILQEKKCIHYLNIENESDCNYLNYNSNQAKYQYFILSSRLRLKEKVLHCFRDQEIPKIVQIDPVEDEHRGPLQVQCLRYQLQITYCVRIPIIGSSYSFLQSGLTTIYFRDKIFHKLVLLTKTQKLHRDILNK